MIRRATLIVTGMLLVAVLGSGCGRDASPGTIAAPTTLIQGNTDSYTYELACPSPLGDLTTSLTYTVTDDAEQVHPGQEVTYRIVAPVAQVKAPITPTFVSSTTTFKLPEGLQATKATTDPPANESFTSSSAQLTNGELVYQLTGSFPVDGTPHATPTIVVSGTVTPTAANNSTITWMTPTTIDGKADAGILGEQSSNCTFPTSGPIGTTAVVS